MPFVDVLNTMMDETLPLTIAEYEEWGNPKDPVYYNYIRQYSPYENIPHNASTFPNIFVRSSYRDPRIKYWGKPARLPN